MLSLILNTLSVYHAIICASILMSLLGSTNSSNVIRDVAFCGLTSPPLLGRSRDTSLPHTGARNYISEKT